MRAAGDGVVVYSGSGLVGYGELIIVKHNDAWLSAYGHNRKRLVNEGQLVKAGQQIAEMGHSGAARDMLHFEIRYNGKPVDPLQYLPQAMSVAADGRKRRAMPNVAVATTYGQHESRDHPPAFAGQHVERARGGGVGHHFDADAAGQAGGHHRRRRETPASAPVPSTTTSGVSASSGSRSSGVHRRGIGHRPVLDQRVGRDDEAAFQHAVVDQRCWPSAPRRNQA